jgi:hypothetical protein
MSTSTSVGHATPVVYSAATVTGVLGFPAGRAPAIPALYQGETVLWYGGWDLAALRTRDAGAQHLSRDRRFDEVGRPARPGYYRLLLPVPQSRRKTWREQFTHVQMLGGWQPAPLVLVATALLVHLALTGTDLLSHTVCRCAEALPDHRHVGLGGLGSVVVGAVGDGDRGERLGLAAVRKH